MIAIIAAKEVRSLIMSPAAWIIAALVQILAAYFFMIYLDYFISVQDQLRNVDSAPGLTELVVSPLFITVAIIFLIIIPLLTMRLISEERSKKTLVLLFSSPVSMSEIVLGKFVGTLLYVYVLILIISTMPLSLLFGTSLDMGLFFSSLLGLILVTSSFTAVGLFMSTLSSQPFVAAIATWVLLLFLWIMELGVKTEQSSTLFSYLSMLHHYTPMMKGVINTTDVIYYLLFTSTFLILSIRRMDAIRNNYK